MAEKRECLVLREMSDVCYMGMMHADRVVCLKQSEGVAPFTLSDRTNSLMFK